jgi:cell division protein FtsW
MASKVQKIDRVFLLIVAAILIFGLLMFGSAALGVLAKHEVKFYSILVNQLVYALLGGLLALGVGLFIHYTHFKKYSFYIYLATLFLTALVFVPGIGFSHGGATRWIHIFNYSLQPSEFLKIGTVLFFASWLAANKKRLDDRAFGLIPFGLIAGVPFLLILIQPDTGTGAIIFLSAFAMYIVAGARWRDVATIFLVGLIGLALLATFRPYVKDRIMTFMDPSRDASGSSYQLQQSLIAIGSGGPFGRGYGQSIQKFNFLPEPIGDSIFSVIGEELGLVGGSIILLLFSALAVRGFKLARMVKDSFGSYLIVGITCIFLIQAFMNISSMLGIFPLTGVPLPFISHGGTALLTALFGVGIILNVSKYRSNI